MIKSVWFVMDAVNQLEKFKITHPSDHTLHQAIASEFESVISVSFSNCAGCVDEHLI